MVKLRYLLVLIYKVSVILFASVVFFFHVYYSGQLNNTRTQIKHASKNKIEKKLTTLEKVAETAAKYRHADVIPIIHQSWKTNHLPPLFNTWSQSFNSCFPNYTHVIWTDEDNLELITKFYPWFLPSYNSYGIPIQKADVVRLFYMYHFGGIYCDLDCECMHNFEHLLRNTSLAFGAMEGKMIRHPMRFEYVAEGHIENSFMYSRPKHPFFWKLIVQLNATTVGQPVMSTGPYLIMGGINYTRKKRLDRTSYQGKSYLTIFPPDYFNPFSWIQRKAPMTCRIYAKFLKKGDEKRCRIFFKHAYIIQYHTQVWGRGAAYILPQAPKNKTFKHVQQALQQKRNTA